MTITKVANLPLADSALHAPRAGFGETEFYADFVDRSAVIVVRLAKNHPLPDGNKRAAWVAQRLFVEINGWSWNPKPTIGDAEHAMLAVAAGEWREAEMATYVALPAWAGSALALRGRVVLHGCLCWRR